MKANTIASYPRGLFLALVTVAVLASPSCAQDAKKRPNILFLFADDMRADVIGALGNLDAKTPNLDRLVRRGMAFTRNYIMGGNQPAVCVPSRAMIMTGKSMFTVSPQIGTTPTWPILLRRAGYTTFMTGKWHNGPASAALSFPGGRAVFLGGMGDPFSLKVADLPDDGTPPKKDLGHIATKHSSELFADEAITFLKKKRAGPWAMYVAFTAPHDPRKAPDEWHAKFDPAKIHLPPNFMPEHPFDNGDMKGRDEQLEKWPRTPEAVRRHLADYHAVIAHLDAQIGRIVEALEASGELDNTIIVFAADNGLAIGSHGLMGKQNLYEHSVRVPLVFAGPGIPKGRTTEALTYLLDLCPTFCELAGVEPPPDIHGRSLVPVLHGERTTHREALLFAYRDLMRGVGDGRHVAIWYAKGIRWQLFDLSSDPHQLRDLALDDGKATTLRSLIDRLATLRKEFGDTAR
jgi:arylsulfatase A-like enzyme